MDFMWPNLASRDGYRTTFSHTLLLCVCVVLLSTSPAEAQEEPILTSPKDAREGEGYEVFKNGMFVIGGDVVGDCNSLLEDARSVGTVGSPEIARQVEVCTKAGFPPRGSASLPDTGGPPFLIVAGALLPGICAVGSLWAFAGSGVGRESTGLSTKLEKWPG